MALQTDSVISLKEESSFGTAVTPDISYPFTDEQLDYLPTYTQSEGSQSGQLTDAADDRILTKEEVGGSFTVDARTKGMGRLLKAAFGVGVSTNITGAAYQQLFTPANDDFLPSYTIQKGIPLLGGAIQPMTFDGMVCSKLELSAQAGGLLSIKTDWVGRALATDTSLASPAYPASTRLFSFVGGSILTGSITPPTTTALASGGTTVANVRSFDATLDNNLDGEGFFFGGAGRRARKPVVGMRKFTGSLQAEYTSNDFRDAYLQQTNLALVLRFATTVAITGSIFPTIEFTFPCLRLDSGLPKAVRGSGATVTGIDFTVLDGRSASKPFYGAIITAETAIG